MVELFLKVDRSWGEGWNSCRQIPTSRSVAVGVFADDSVDATKDSESMENGAQCMKLGELEIAKKRLRAVLILPSRVHFFCFAISPIDNAVFALFALRALQGMRTNPPRYDEYQTLAAAGSDEVWPSGYFNLLLLILNRERWQWHLLFWLALFDMSLDGGANLISSGD